MVVHVGIVSKYLGDTAWIVLDYISYSEMNDKCVVFWEVYMVGGPVADNIFEDGDVVFRVGLAHVLRSY